MVSPQTRWQIAGDYFENCNCEVACPCIFSPSPPFTAKPTAGACEVGIAFHIDRGSFGDVTLDGLNVIVMARTPGPMADGNWSVALYLDDHADAQQQEALQAIFTGAAGGPVANLTPLISAVLGAKTVPITFNKGDKRRSVEIPGVMKMAVHAAPGLVPDKEIWAVNASPLALDGLAMAVGDE